MSWRTCWGAYKVYTHLFLFGILRKHFYFLDNQICAKKTYWKIYSFSCVEHAIVNLQWYISILWCLTSIVINSFLYMLCCQATPEIYQTVLESAFLTEFHALRCRFHCVADRLLRDLLKFHIFTSDKFTECLSVSAKTGELSQCCVHLKVSSALNICW